MNKNDGKVAFKHQEKIDKSGVVEFARGVGNQLLTAMKNKESVLNKEGIKSVFPPFNPDTKNYYSGVNFLQLALSGEGSDPRWFTEKGLYKLDLEPKIDADRESVVHVGTTDFRPVLNNETGEHEKDVNGAFKYEAFNKKDSPIFTAFNLVNGKDVENLEQYIPPFRDESFVDARLYELLVNSGATIKHGADDSYYDRADDVIYLKDRSNYNSANEYLSDALGRLGEWSYDSKRLNKETFFEEKGSIDYYKEELASQISSYMMAVKLGSDFNESAIDDYHKAWERVLDEDPLALLVACAEAEDVNEYVLGYLDKKEPKSDYTVSSDGLLLDQDGEIAKSDDIAFEKYFPVSKSDDVLTIDQIIDKYGFEALEGADNEELDRDLKAGGINLRVKALQTVAEANNLSLDLKFNDKSNDFEMVVKQNLGASIGLKFQIDDTFGITGYSYNRESESFDEVRTNSPLMLNGEIRKAMENYREDQVETHKSLKSLGKYFLDAEQDQKSLWVDYVRSDIDNNPVRTMLKATSIINDKGMYASIVNFDNIINVRVHDTEGYTGLEFKASKASGNCRIYNNNEMIGRTFSNKLNPINRNLSQALSNYEKEKISTQDAVEKAVVPPLISQEYGSSLVNFERMKSVVESSNIPYFQDKQMGFRDINQGGKLGISITADGKDIGAILYADDQEKSDKVTIVFIDPFQKPNETANIVVVSLNDVESIYQEVAKDREALSERVYTEIDALSDLFIEKDKAWKLISQSYEARPMQNNLAFSLIGAKKELESQGREPRLSFEEVKVTNGEEQSTHSFVSLGVSNVPKSQMHMRLHPLGRDELILNGVRSNADIKPTRVVGMANGNNGISVGMNAVKRMDALASQKLAKEKTWLYIDVTDKEGRAEAKKNGALWDKEVQCWYVQKGTDLNKVDKWLNPTFDPQAPPEIQFAQELRANGFLINDGEVVVTNGNFVYCAVVGDTGGKKSGRYAMYSAEFNTSGRAGGSFVNHKVSEEVKKWAQRGTGIKLTSEQQAQLARMTADKQKEDQRLREIKYEKASTVAQTMWKEAEGVVGSMNHRYIQNKQILNHTPLRVVPSVVSSEAYELGIRVVDNTSQRTAVLSDAQKNNEDVTVFIKGELLIPAMRMDGKIMTLQKVNAQKTFMSGGEKTGNFYTTDGKLPSGKAEIIIAEGYATADSVSRLSKKQVVIAFDAGNVVNVAKLMREKFPETKITIACDNDHKNGADKNTGVIKAQQAIDAVGGIIVVPPFTRGAVGTDWNDYMIEFGVKKATETYRGIRAEALVDFEKMAENNVVNSRENDAEEDFDHDL